MLRRIPLVMVLMAAMCCVIAADAQEKTASFKKGTVELTSVGPIAFAPKGVLLISDPMAATIFAVQTDDTSGAPSAELSVKNVRGKVAAMLGTQPRDVSIEDLVVNPASGNVFLAVSRGTGEDKTGLILKVNKSGDLDEVSLEDVQYTSAKLANAPASEQSRRGNRRMMTVTDLAYVDGQVFIAGLSNEEFASKLYAAPYPFASVDRGTSVEIYHGAHGAVETRSPIMTFASYAINDEPHIVAAYTCTPLVKLPVKQLKPGAKVTGTTIAELGNGNRPIDMFVYEKDGKQYILMANDRRGVMKITTENIDGIEGITERVGRGDTAGLPYETIKELQGVVQLDRLDQNSGLALIRNDDGTEDITTVPLP